MEETVYHVLICENDLLSLEINKRYVELFSVELERKVEIHTSIGISEELQNMPNCGKAVDMAILDVKLQGESGIQFAKRLQENNPTIPIIFITDMEQYRTQASEIMALGLLGKPVSPEQFGLLFQRAVAQLDMEKNQEENTYLEIQINKRNIGVKMNSIISMEKQQKKVYMKTKSGTYEFRDTLSAVEQKLPSYFLRVSQSVIVNMKEVICIEGNQVFTSAHEDFVIGRTYQKRVDVRYRRYWK